LVARKKEGEEKYWIMCC